MKTFLNYLLTLMILAAVTPGVSAQEIPEKNYNVVQMASKKLEDASKKVYIKNFKVFYQMIAEAEKTSYGGRQVGGGSYTGNATARLAVGVEGVDPEDLQELTDKLYNEYVARLESMGFEIISSEDLIGNEFFEDYELLKGPRINQEQIEGSLMVVPSGYSYFVKGVNKKGKEKTGGFMAGVTGDDGGFGSSLYGPVPKVSKALDDAMVIEISLDVPSIYLDPKSNLAGAKVKGGAYLRLQQGKVAYIAGESSKPGVAAPEAGFEVLLTKPVMITGVFGEQNFKSEASKARTSVPSYGGFFTVQNTSVNLTNSIKCEAEDYKTRVGDVLSAYLNLTLDKLEMGLQGDKVK
jgi:hypothetical protein